MSYPTRIVYEPKFQDLLGESRQAKYLIDYLRAIGAKCCIVEDNYIDKDYLIDYQIFYSRSFYNFPRFTTRYHFFGKRIYGKTFEKKLEEGNSEELHSLLQPYLGFVITKPVEDSYGRTLIGRSLLKTYQEEDGTKQRYFVKTNYNVSLFGVKLKIDSIPFQMQDQRVSACATIALWTTIHALAIKFEIPKYSPGEVTQISTSSISESRDFPQGGLSLEQMINCIKSLSLDVEPILIDGSNYKQVPDIVRAYLSTGIPILATLELKKNGKKYAHASVITGYKCDSNGKVIEVYTHDDGIGPYSRVLPLHGFLKWDNEWRTWGYDVTLERLLIPVYPKIRLLFKRMYSTSLEHQGIINQLLEKQKIKTHYDVRLVLSTVQDYKERLTKQKVKLRSIVLKARMPRFLWIEHYYLKNKLVFDLLYDATGVYPSLVMDYPIEYE
jgi:hypothetical protein